MIINNWKPFLLFLFIFLSVCIDCNFVSWFVKDYTTFSDLSVEPSIVFLAINEGHEFYKGFRGNEFNLWWPST